jgi:hypothetical protein
MKLLQQRLSHQTGARRSRDSGLDPLGALRSPRSIDISHGEGQSSRRLGSGAATAICRRR